MRTGKLLQSLNFESPWTALFFNHSPNTYIVACTDAIFVIDANTQFMQPFDDTPQRVCYSPHSLALSADDAVLCAGCFSNGQANVCVYNTTSRIRLWIYSTGFNIGAVLTLDQHVLATVFLCQPTFLRDLNIGANVSTLVLDLNTGVHVASLQDGNCNIVGLGVVEG
jgi:hypothetical protein